MMHNERSSKPSGVHVLFATVPAGDGEDGRPVGEAIAESLVKEGLAACVTRLPGAVSTYSWEGKVEVDREEQLVLKAPSEMVESLVERIQALHPYDVPEVLALPVDKGLPEYLAWILEGREMPL